LIPFSITSSAYQDGFVAKYNEFGRVQWAKAINGAGEQVWGIDVTSDANNNVYATGFFKSQYVRFTPTDSIQLNPGSSSDVFLVKYNSNGVFQWAKSGAGTYSLAKSVTCDSQNNVIITGSYNDLITFSGTSSASSLTGLYMAKYDPQGNLIWLKSGTSAGQCWFNDLASDASNNIYATGKISTTFKYGSQTISNHGGDDLVIAKFNSSGDLQWMKVVGNTIAASTTSNNFDSGTSIALDPSGNVFVGGALIDTAYWGSWGSQIYQFATVMKYDNNGNQQWIKKYGNHENDIINDVAIDNNGDVCVIGNYFDTLAIGSFQLPIQLTNDRAFIAKFNGINGNPIYAEAHGTTTIGNNTGVGIQVNPLTNQIYTTGVFKNSFNFGSNTVQTAGSWDIYLILNTVLLDVVQNQKNSDKLLIYPNPASSKVTISIPNKSLNDAEVFIYNLNGQLILQQQMLDQQNEINIEALEIGNYILKIRSHEGEFHQKLIKL
jgi:hypothetical protein